MERHIVPLASPLTDSMCHGQILSVQNEYSLLAIDNHLAPQVRPRVGFKPINPLKEAG